MKKTVLLFGLCLFTVFMACAQQKKFISYTVKKGETVRKIAKKYDLKSKQILRLNPGLKKKPAANTVILIPNINYSEQEEKKKLDNTTTVKVMSSENHIVRAKETIYGISKQYNVSIESLKELNPDLLIDGLKIGMILEIPKVKMLTPEELKRNELDYWAENFVLHTVVKDDTLYSLTRSYNVSKEKLLELNPLLVDGLKLGTVLKIKEKVFDAELESLKTSYFLDSIVTKDTIAMTMLLPFKFPKNDTLGKEQLFTNKNNLISIITDFYLGADIAIDSLRKQGLAIDVNIYDTQNNRDTIKSLIKTKTLEATDVVFGPVFNQHVNYVAQELKETPVVFPFYSSKQKNFTKDNIVKTVTSRDLLKENMLTYFSEIYNSEHILIVGDEKLSSKKEFKQIEEFLKVHNDSVKMLTFLQPENGYISKERFVQSVDTLGVNWVILTSNDKVVTADVINNLKSIPNDAEVRLFAFEKGYNFSKVDNNMLAEMNFAYASSGFFVDSLPEVSSFYNQFLRKNNSYPSEYASKGFDIVYDILMRMAASDSLNLKESFNRGLSKRVRSSFKYEQKSYGEPVYNTAVYLRKYNSDLSVEPIRLKRNSNNGQESTELEVSDKAVLEEYSNSVKTEGELINTEKIFKRIE